MKLSQTLKMVVELQENIVAGTVPGAWPDSAEFCKLGLCFALNDAQALGLVSWDDKDAAKVAISQRLRHKTGWYGYLFDKLKAQKKGSSFAHRVAWYKRWIAQLEAKGL